MNSVTPVKLTLPEGVECELRFTLGARKRITDHFGMPMQEALNKHDSGAFPAIIHALTHTEKGKPTLELEWLAENLPLDGDSSAEILAAIMSAATQGKTPKNELEALLKAQMQGVAQKTTGSTPSASEHSASDSAGANSGGDTSSAKSSQESNATEN
jgi:hypothetical protein